MNITAYYRVSTSEQGESGLGLEAQKHTVESHASRTGCRVIAEFTEVESGRKDDRPELAKALQYAKDNGSTLVVAKLDRLARSVSFTCRLMEAGVDFVCCDFPTANKLTIHIMAAMAEHEADVISERIIAALAAAKRRGVKLGSHREGFVNKGSTKGYKHAKYDSRLVAQMKQLRDKGETYKSIALALNDQGWKTSKGNDWSSGGVHNVLNHACFSV